jgi:hypothetical protein
MRGWALLACVVASLLASPAAAHRPFFTQVGTIQLPNGERGEVRLLHGDGIFGPDPVRAIVIDERGRLRARSERSLFMGLSCPSEARCTIFDFARDQVLEVDLATLRVGSLVPGLSDRDRDDLWDIEDGNEAWGFVAREPNASEWRDGLRTKVRLAWPVLAFNGIAGGVAWLLMRVAMARGRRQHVLKAVPPIFLALVLVLVSGYFTLLGGLDLSFWLWPFALACGLLQGMSPLWRRWRRR